MLTWISIMTHAMLWWTKLRVLDTVQRFLSVTDVPPTAVHVSEMWCSGQGNLHFTQKMEHAPPHVMIEAGITWII
jgi:hypothetical protein